MRSKLLLIFFLFCFSGIYANGWLYDFDKAQKTAIAMGKLMFIDFTANWCVPCKKMEMEAFADKQIAALMENYVLLKIDFDSNPSFRMKYGVKAIPNILITDANGLVLDRKVGYGNKIEVKNFFEKYQVNTDYLRGELSLYYRNTNYASALRLGRKYLNFSIYTNPKISLDFLNLAQVYINEARHLLDKKQGNYEVMQQKIVLLELNNLLFSSKFRRFEKKLNDFKENEIFPENRNIFLFLQYCLHHQKNHITELALVKTKLEAQNKGEVLLERAEHFLN